MANVCKKVLSVEEKQKKSHHVVYWLKQITPNSLRAYFKATWNRKSGMVTFCKKACGVKTLGQTWILARVNH